MTSISGSDHSPSFFTTSCLRLQFGQCHASSAPNTSARVYSWSDKTFMCALYMKYYWYQYSKQLKEWERHYSQELGASIFRTTEFGSGGCWSDLEEELYCSHINAGLIRALEQWQRHRPCTKTVGTRVCMRQVAIFRSTNVQNSHWLDTTFIPASLHSFDWTKSLQSSYIINISLRINHFNIHLNQIQSPWRWRQHIPLECPNTHIIWQIIKTKQTTISTSSFIIFIGLQRRPNASSISNVCTKLCHVLNLQKWKTFTRQLNLTQTEEQNFEVRHSHCVDQITYMADLQSKHNYIFF